MGDGLVRSPRLPGGDLVAAALNREVMGLADRGGSSGLVGSRWADLCAEQATEWVGQARPVPDAEAANFTVELVARLDATPQIAAAASKRGLQNPDLLLIGRRGERQAVQAADAKFSVETARAKQVSPVVVENLLGLGPLITSQLGNLEPAPALLPGVFLCPDFPLTHLMLHRRQGIVRTTVRAEQVVPLPAPARAFFAPLEGFGLLVDLAKTDALPTSTDEDLLAALYYFRLARAAIGCWLDATKPLLLFNDRLVVDEAAVRADAAARAHSASSAYGLITSWFADVDTIRGQRAAVDQVAALPLLNRDVRALVARLAAERGATPPSVNQVRRRIGAWYRARLREQVGPLVPPVADLAGALRELANAGAALQPLLLTEAERIVHELLDQQVEGSGDEPEALLGDDIG